MQRAVGIHVQGGLAQVTVVVQCQMDQLLQFGRLEIILPGRWQHTGFAGLGRVVCHALWPAVGHGGDGLLIFRGQAATGQGQRDGQTQVSDLHTFSPAA